MQLILVFVKYGKIYREYSFTSGIEVFFTFLYFLALFWIFPQISDFFESEKLKKVNSVKQNFLEGILVLLGTFLLTAFLKILPMWLLLLYYNSQHEDLSLTFDVDSLRQNVIIHAILALLIYYFVERERIQNQRRKEHLKYARLQRQEFEGQLQTLKNRVNPEFLFNSLLVLDSLIKKDAEEAAHFVGHLSYVYRFFLEQKDQLIPLQEEIKLASTYIYILSAGKREKIFFSVDISEEIKISRIPPGTLRGIIEQVIFDSGSALDDWPEIKITDKTQNLLLHFKFAGKKKILPLQTLQLQETNHRYQFFTERKAKTTTTETEHFVELPILKTEES